MDKDAGKMKFHIYIYTFKLSYIQILFCKKKYKKIIITYAFIKG